ncbi:putative N-acetyltransferase [Zostera marina]|uniref:N-alpha-acetyltransferase 60 n=1 Tax=Zostera marina TaxID=29655 RepID=A0A0K9NZ56_ZOSMR|nr:putative N-acetyltransferase [Zostera marina]
MLEKAAYSPTIVYRRILPHDLKAVEQLHAALFPIRYELEFFLNVVNSHGIISWAAVDGETQELVGFVTTRIILAKESEIVDLLKSESSRTEQTLVYILTLGVSEQYRNLGIAFSLVQEVIKYGSDISSCRAVYLHVIDYNEPAIQLYKKMSFKLARRLQMFYYIRGYHYDSFLFVYYVNGGQSPCSPLELITSFAVHLKNLFTSLRAKLQRNDTKKLERWLKCKERDSSLTNSQQNKRILGAENSLSQCV